MPADWPGGPSGGLPADSKQQESPIRTLCLRNVPDEVAEHLERLTAQAGLPLSVFAVRGLTEASLRANAASQLATLPDLAVPADAIMAALGSERDERGSWPMPPRWWRPC